MRRVCYLHLGMNKSGSSSIQHVFAGYSDGRVSYAGGRQSNHYSLMGHYSQRVRHRPAMPEKTPILLRDDDALLEAFLAELRSGEGSIFLSAENLSDPVFHDDAVKALAQECLASFDEVLAFAYVREPVSFITSALQQSAKTGHARFELARYYPGYRRRFARWFEALGASRVILVPFDPAAWVGGDLLCDVAARLGLDAAPARQVRVNASLSADAFAVLYAVRCGMGDDIGPGMSERMLRLSRDLGDFGSGRLSIAPELCRDIMRARANDIAWVEERMGRPLPPYRSPARALVFNSEDEVLDHARALGVDIPALAAGKPWPGAKSRWTGRLRRLVPRGR